MTPTNFHIIYSNDQQRIPFSSRSQIQKFSEQLPPLRGLKIAVAERWDYGQTKRHQIRAQCVS